MKYLIDSDFLADYLKGRTPAIEVLGRLRVEGLAVSVITLGEVYEGIYFGNNPRGNERGLTQLLRRVTILPVTEQIDRRYARIRGELRQRGQLIGDPDLLIAATALHHDLTLLTRNRRDFERVPALGLWRDDSP